MFAHSIKAFLPSLFQWSLHFNIRDSHQTYWFFRFRTEWQILLEPRLLFFSFQKARSAIKGMQLRCCPSATSHLSLSILTASESLSLFLSSSFSHFLSKQKVLFCLLKSILRTSLLFFSFDTDSGRKQNKKESRSLFSILSSLTLTSSDRQTMSTVLSLLFSVPSSIFDPCCPLHRWQESDFKQRDENK